MKAYRASKGETEHYTSFEELAKAWGCKPKRKQTKDKLKLEKQRDVFSKKHLCPACKKPMTWIGGNLLTCQNENCKGIKREITDNSTGEIKVYYSPAFELLDETGAEIAYNIFTDFEN